MAEENRIPENFVQQTDENGVPVAATTPVDLPVISAETNARRERRNMRGAERASDKASRSSSKRRRRGLRDWTGAVVILLILAGIVGGFVWYTTVRDVTVLVDGAEMQVQVNSTLEEVVSAAGVRTQSGDLYSINGNLLQEGAGDPYTVSVDGYTLSRDAQARYRVQGGESFSFEKGPDTVEDSTTEVRTCLPKLEYPSYTGSITYVAQWGVAGTQEFQVGLVSGETIPGGVVEQPTNTVIKTLDPHPDNTRQLVALTFDDGPSAYTQKMLAVLAEYHVPATFFLLGDQVEENPIWTGQVVASGCQILSHTYGHEYLPNLDDDAFLYQINQGFSALSSAGITPGTAIRSPYGAFGAESWLRSGGIVSVHVGWSVDSDDWKSIDKPAATTSEPDLKQGEDESDEDFQKRVDEAREKAATDAATAADQAYAELLCAGIHSGDIILLHDGGGNRDFELAVLPVVITQLQSQGFEFVTVSDLMASDPSIPDDIAACTATMPEDAVWPEELA